MIGRCLQLATLIACLAAPAQAGGHAMLIPSDTASRAAPIEGSTPVALARAMRPEERASAPQMRVADVSADGERAGSAGATPSEAPIEGGLIVAQNESGALDGNVAITVILAEGAAAEEINGFYEFVPLDGDQPADEAVASGYGTVFAETLEPGRYLLRYDKDLITASMVVEVPRGERIERAMVLNAGLLDVAVRAAEGAAPAENGAFEITAGETAGGGYGTGTLVVPAGPATAKAMVGLGSLTEDLTVTAGERQPLDLVVGVGVLSVSAVYSEGGAAVTDESLVTEILRAKMRLDGSRESLAGEYGATSRYELPPGDYLVRARLGHATGEAKATVTTGEASTVVIDVDAGVLAVAAPGASWIEIFAAERGSNGDRASIAGDYGEALQTALPPGDYVVVRTGDGETDRREAPVTVIAGERNALTLD